MNKPRVSIALMVLLAPCLSASAMAQVRMAESSVRRVATAKVVPTYPPSSIKAGATGVAVASIVSDLTGAVTTVDILEAPDSAIAEAVRAALKQWKVPPVTVMGRQERMGVTGKVTYYFRIVDGRGRVLDPFEMPEGPKPEPAGGPPSAPPGARQPGATAPVVTSHGPVRADIELGLEEFTRRMASDKPTVIDIRPRDDFRRQHRAGVLNIPRDELVVRARIELDRTRPVVIDCTYAESNDCHNAASSISRIPLKVWILIP